MAEREVYARAWATMPGIELTIGVALHNETPAQIREMTTQLWEIAHNALSQQLDVYTAAVAYAEKRVLEFWPGRPYFIESEEDGQGVQVFQPWGLPVDHVAVPSSANVAARASVEIEMPGNLNTTFELGPVVPVSVPVGSGLGHSADCHLKSKTLRGCYCGADHQ